MLHARFIVKLLIGCCFTLFVLGCDAAQAPIRLSQVTFKADGAVRHAVLALPSRRTEIKGSVIFVHGDGAMNSFADGYYEPIWRMLASKGIASISWDKPGVDEAPGNWLSQTMDDRASTVLAAYSTLQETRELAGKPVGLIGFSQASWVMPKALRQNPNLKFAAFVSTPTNWLEQSEYMTVLRLVSEGKDDAFIEQQLGYDALLNELITSGASFTEYQTFIQNHIPQPFQPAALDPARYEFIQKNMLSDSTEDLNQIDQPIFLMLGAQDANIDVENNLVKYQSIFQYRPSQLRYSVYQNALHSMLKADEFSSINSPFWAWLKMIMMEEHAFQPEFLNDLGNWVEQQVEAN
ncbi:alpha/beta hydrolase family protein (plasmid) [Pseudoalteromonas sp. T1lg65]|uniref:alpha/beta hydrolase family protein n=1 Tax=Pseudoalteromonas sp. T1lg65 TaxID=2077101 RepID=UPI003F7B0CBF